MTTTRIRTHRLLVLGALLPTALLAACTDDQAWPGSTTSPPGGGSPSAVLASDLREVQDCDELVEAARPALRRAVEALWATDATTTVPASRAMEGAMEDSAGFSAETAAAPPTAAADGSVIGTNNQEQGVDEGDLVKTDGERLVSVVDGVLRVTTLDGDPTVDGTLSLMDRGANELFLRGDEAVVIGTRYGDTYPAGGIRGSEDDGTLDDAELIAPAFPVATTVTRVSLVDPAAPTVVESAELEGSVAATRMIDGRIRLVVRGEPVAMMDVMTSSNRTEALAVVEDLDAGVLVPRLAVDGEVGELGGCSDVLLPATPEGPDPTGLAPAAGAGFASDSSFTAGPQTITVVSIGDTFTDLQPVSIQGGADVTYASSDALFVASSVWDVNGSRTDVHRFALGGEGPAEYTGSGSAPGNLLNQFSLSERDGALRVVTTVQGGGEAMATSGRLTVLDTAGSLDEIGHVDDLGPGETVRSVRFVDDLGYVVTFRQTDPLYALDLSDPSNPRVLGELKIPGFSEYLHPVGEGLLLGVGREVDPETMQDQGLKVSLFDVSDPAAMAEVDRLVLADAWSPVSGDHHAFTWDPGRAQAVVPLDRSCMVLDGGGPATSGPAISGAAETTLPAPAEIADCASRGSALVVGVQEGRLVTRGEWSHESGYGAIAPLRTVVVGADLWSVSSVGLGRTNADDPSSVVLQPY